MLGALVIAIHDIRTYKIPDFYLALLLIALVVYDFIFSRADFINHVAGFFVAGLFLLFIYLFTKQGMGFGDVKYSAVIGYFLGIIWWAGALFIASVSGILFFICIRIIRKWDFQRRFPFAPFLSFGAVLTGILAAAHSIG